MKDVLNDLRDRAYSRHRVKATLLDRNFGNGAALTPNRVLQ